MTLIDEENLFLKPRELYPTLLQGTILPPIQLGLESRLLDIVKTFNYEPASRRDTLDRCIVNVIMYDCEYSRETMGLIKDIVAEIRTLIRR